jgi:hypothetical protein
VRPQYKENKSGSSLSEEMGSVVSTWIWQLQHRKLFPKFVSSSRQGRGVLCNKWGLHKEQSITLLLDSEAAKIRVIELPQQNTTLRAQGRLWILLFIGKPSWQYPGRGGQGFYQLALKSPIRRGERSVIVRYRVIYN